MEFRIATTDVLKEKSYQLRHSVYCIEKRWERPTPFKVERDVWDEGADHLVILDEGVCIACARWIHERPLPMERFWRTLDPISKSYIIELDRLHEISRFTVRRDYRRQGVARDLVLALIAMGSLMNKENVIAMMAPALPRLAKRWGVYFCQIGFGVEYHGMRAAYFASRGFNESQIRSALLSRYEYIVGVLR